MNNVVMGQVYFELDNTTETKEKLNQFFIDAGFELLERKLLGNELYSRVSRFTNNDGLEFDVIWFRNLAHIRFGEWNKAHIEFTFTKIIGSYVPDVDHFTFDFLDNQNRTGKISIKK